VVEHPTLASTALTTVESPDDSIPCVNSVFEQPWWLDCVAPGAWSEAVVRRGDDVVARLPYARRQRFGLTMLMQPRFTQTLGPWLAGTESKYARRLETEKKLMGQLIEMLPPFDLCHMCFSPVMTNWLPFYWAGFQATVCYTYRIEGLSDLERVQHHFQDHVRRGIRKAQHAVEVDHDFPLDELLRLDAQTYARQGLTLPHSHELLRRLDSACAARGQRRILGAVDAGGRPHAALYVAWDERVLYALINARDPERQAVGANTMLYWEAIRLASEVSRIFDFEGSMIEPIEHYVRGFGGRQTPYFCVSKAGIKGKSALAARNARHALRRLGRSSG
jgi:GNAT acetyltransferase-like protein